MMPLPPVYDMLFSFAIARTPGWLDPLPDDDHAEKLEFILDQKAEGGELRFEAFAFGQETRRKTQRSAPLSKTDYLILLNKADLSRSADKRQDLFAFEPQPGPAVLHYGRGFAACNPYHRAQPFWLHEWRRPLANRAYIEPLWNEMLRLARAAWGPDAVRYLADW